MHHESISRRNVLRFAALGGAACLVKSPLMGAEASAANAADVVQDVESFLIWKGQKQKNWMHPRACYVPGSPSKLFMTLQDIHGSDSFGPLHWTESLDAGNTWADPQPIPTLDPGEAKGSESQEATCDVVPTYHAKTDTILAIGHTVYYRNTKFYKPQPPRRPVYVARDAQGNWTPRRKVVWDDPRGSQVYSSGCSQRVTLDNGELLIPMTFGTSVNNRSVATFRCAFDGQEVTIREVGSEIRSPGIGSGGRGRGLLEPSLTTIDGRYYVTMRAEDGCGYVAVSEDGMNWGAPAAWSWDDGTRLTMSTTQQHWLTHSDALYLVYTRKDESNEKTFRWRAPLFMALVDRATMRLVRSTERIAIPMKAGTKQYGGNFHCVNVNANESMITDSIGNGGGGDAHRARVRWTKPNRVLP